jgi:hypothetical protein
VIPSDVIEDAMDQAETTLSAKADTSPEGMAKMVEAFAPFGVTREMIEARIQRNLESISPAQVVTLKRIWVSLRDGMSRAGQWFEAAAAQDAARGGESLAAVKEALGGGQAMRTPTPPSRAPVPPSSPVAAPAAAPPPAAADEAPPWTDDAPAQDEAPDPAEWLRRVKSAQSFDDLQALDELIAVNFPEGQDRALLVEALAHRDRQLTKDQTK